MSCFWDDDQLALYVVIETRQEQQEDHWKPVPMEAFSRLQILVIGVELQIIIEMDPVQLAEAQGFEQNNLPDLDNERWDTGIRSFWQLE